ncbi:MAG TPA: hypothetical protein DEB42_00385 [Jeotgalicoccus sp.]|nr:hypothetical protein [Jeotgalicoccus sp.]
MSKTRLTRQSRYKDLTVERNYLVEEDDLKLSDMRLIVLSKKELEVTYATLRRYNSAISYLIDYAGDIKVKELTTKLIYDFMHYLKVERETYQHIKNKKVKKKGLHSSTINGHIDTLKASIEVLLDYNYLDEKTYYNPLAKVKRLPVAKQKPRGVSKEDLNAFMKKIDTRYFVDLRLKTAVYLMLETMCRVEELTYVKKSDIDFDSRTITMTKTKNKEFRTLPFTRKTEILLKQLIDDIKEFDTEYVFINTRGYRIAPAALRKTFAKTSELAGLEHPITPHRLRHSGAIEALSNGMNIRAVQKILGHGDLRTTMIYLNISDNHLIEAQEKYSALSMLTEDKKETKLRKRRSYK